MVSKTALPPRMRLKHAMTATAFSLVAIRNTWRAYLNGLSTERQEMARRQRPTG